MKIRIAAVCGVYLLAGISAAQATTINLPATTINTTHILSTSQNDMPFAREPVWGQLSAFSNQIAPSITAPVPEPTTYALIILCLIGLIVTRRKRLSYK